MTDPQPRPPILTYDRADTNAGNANRKPLLAYFCGLLISHLFYAVIWFAFKLQPLPHLHPREDSYKFLLAILLLWLFDCLLAAMLLVTLIWIRSKRVHNVRYASFRDATCWGALANIIPLPLLTSLHISDETKAWICAITLAWHVLIPCIASFFLCHRSHLRD